MIAEDDSKVLGIRTWNKVENNAKTNGFREGISDGQEKCFQKYFDKGFAEGFKNGFSLGELKGTLRVLNIHEDELQKTSRGNCLYCKHGEEKCKLEELITEQDLSTKNLILKLKDKHSVN